MRVELRLLGSNQPMGHLDVGEHQSIPHPGLWLEWNDRSFLVLRRRHRYTLRFGRYQLASVVLEVKPQAQPADAQWWKGQWVIGDPDCHFNARSPLLRCAVLPEGPCDRCGHFQRR